MGLSGWLRPELLFGFLGVLIPLIVHLLGRRKKREIPIATLRFLKKAAAKSSARWRLRRILLLLSRMAALFFLAALFAGPGCESGNAGAGGKTVLILDVSPSMGQKIEGTTALERARAELSSIISSAAPDSGFAVITTARENLQGEEMNLFVEPRLALGMVEGADIAQDDGGLARALDKGYAIASAGGGALVVVATDMQKNAFRGVEAGKKPPAGVVVIDAGQKEPKNAWVQAAAQNGGEVEVSLGWCGPRPEGSTVRLKGEKGGDLTAFVDNGKASFHPQSGEDFRELSISVEPGGDLSYDDALPFAGDAGGVVKVLIINGDPKTLEIEDETLFLRRALSSGKKMEGRFEVRSIRIGELSPRDLDGVSVAWLANPHGLSPATRGELLSRVRAGMGLVVSAGEGWELSGSGEELFDLLAAPIRFTLNPKSAGKTRPPHQEIDQQSFTGALSRFSGKDLAPLSSTRARGYWMIDAGAGGGALVLSRLADQSPLVAERSEGKGMLVTLATSIDRDWADLCLKPQFLPFVDRLLLHASGKLKKEIPPYLVVGRDSLDPLAAPVTIVSPSGVRSQLLAGGAPFSPALAGFYRVEEKGRTVGAFVARIDPAESDLTPTGDEEARKLLGDASIKRGGDSGVAGRRDLSPLFGVLMMAALIAEALLSGRFSRRPNLEGLGAQGDGR